MSWDRNAVYTKIRAAALAGGAAFVESTPNPVPNGFPTVIARQSGYAQIVRDTTLVNDDRPWRETWEVQIYSNKPSGSQSEAYAIMEAIESTMASLGYFLDMKEPVQNTDSTVYRLVARWHRVTGNGESVPTSL